MELSPQALAREWKSGKLKPAYLLLGEDSAAALVALDGLLGALKPETFNVDEFPGDSDTSVPEIISACNTAPMLSERRIVILRDLKLGAAARRELALYLKNPLASTTLILVSGDSKPDARDPICAAVSALGGVALFRALKEGEAAARLREEAKIAGFELSAQAAEKMVEEAGSEWGILKAELDKLRLFVRGRGQASLEDALACLGYRRETNPYDLPKSIEKREMNRALGLLRRMITEGSDSFPLLYQIIRALNRQLKAKRMLKAGFPHERIARELPLPGFLLSDYLRDAARVSESRLIRDLRACLEAEVALKSKSWLDPAQELERLVAGLCSSKT